MLVNYGASVDTIRHEIDKETREQEFYDRLNQKNEYRAGSVQRKLEKTGFFGQENVQEYHNQIVTHLFKDKKKTSMGRGTFFDTPDELSEWMCEYFELCSKTAITPTMSGLACWLKCSPETIRSHAHNPNSPFYELCNNALQYCHCTLETGATEGKLNSVAYIFQAKNYFNMRDQQEISVNTNQPVEQINNEDTLKALREQQEREQRVNALLEVKEASFEDIIEANL